MQNKPTKIKIALRGAQSEDLNFIRHSWAKSFRHNCFWPKKIPHQVYFPVHRMLINQALERSTAIMAVNPENENQIFGYIIVENEADFYCVHYLYVKSLFRGFGIANQLIEFCVPYTDFVYYSHLTNFAEFLAKNHNAHYNPYIFMSDQTAELWKEIFNENTRHTTQSSFSNPSERIH